MRFLLPFFVGFLILFSSTLAAEVQGSTIQSFVENYNTIYEKSPADFKNLIGTETIKVNYELADGGIVIFGVKTKDGKITDSDPSPYPGSTLAAYISEETLTRIANSDNPSAALKDAWGTEIKLEGLSFVNKIKVFISDILLLLIRIFTSAATTTTTTTTYPPTTTTSANATTTTSVATTTTAGAHQMEGDDGTWCDDSDGNMAIFFKGTCTDNKGTYTDFCDRDTARDYYCTQTPNATGASIAHCVDGGFICSSNHDGLTSCSDGVCVSPGLPDLNVTSYVKSNSETNPYRYFSPYLNFSVSNIGNADAEAFDVNVSLQNSTGFVWRGSTRINSLAAGSTTYITFNTTGTTYVIPSNQFAYFFNITVDSLNEVAESNEANNKNSTYFLWNQTITVSPPWSLYRDLNLVGTYSKDQG